MPRGHKLSTLQPRPAEHSCLVIWRSTIISALDQQLTHVESSLAAVVGQQTNGKPAGLVHSRSKRAKAHDRGKIDDCTGLLLL